MAIQREFLPARHTGFRGHSGDSEERRLASQPQASVLLSAFAPHTQSSRNEAIVQRFPYYLPADVELGKGIGYD